MNNVANFIEVVALSDKISVGDFIYVDKNGARKATYSSGNYYALTTAQKGGILKCSVIPGNEDKRWEE